MKTNKQETLKMLKKAVLVIELSYKSTQTPNNQIVKEIRKEAQIPWCTKTRKIEVYNSQQGCGKGMVPCPKCGKNNTKPQRVLENAFFKIEAYQCEGCGERFEAIS